MTFSKIVGCGSYLPNQVRTNDDISAMVETSHEWIYERTGISERRIASDDETVSILGYHAAKNALEMAGLDASDIDIIIMGTTTPETFLPSSACLIQAMLGVGQQCPAFDLNAACAGFNYALSIADNFIKSGQYKTALVIGSEVLSRLVNWKDRSTCILFGDGAGAVILQASESPGILSTHIHADGQYADHLTMPNPFTDYRVKDQRPYVSMSGNEVFKHAVKNLGEVINETLEKNKITHEDIDWFIPHQANLRIIKAMAKKFSLPMEKVILTIEKHGNTSSASVPLALDHAVRQNLIKRGDTLLIESFGGGFTWGSALIKF